MVIDSAEWFIKVKHGLGWYDWLFLEVKEDTEPIIQPRKKEWPQKEGRDSRYENS